jgi:CubicO group peptidase (beta-lactamase class C family)
VRDLATRKRRAATFQRKVVMLKSSGFSRARLRRMSDVMRGFVDRGEVPGIVTLLCRHDETHVDAYGVLDFGTHTPVQRDSLFRIASMTKPVTAVAALSLIEEARLRLDDPVATWLPELAEQRVLRRIDGEIDDTVPLSRAITVRDLLTFRLGSGMLLGPVEPVPIQRALERAGIDMGPESPRLEPDLWIERFGALPLMHQPGEQWMYHTGSNVLSVLIARVAGMSFESFLRERIFEPLGMKDTWFDVPESERARLMTPYQLDAEGGLVRFATTSERTYAAGATGLVSTADDFLQFGRMLLRYGRLGSERILARPTVEVMTTDQLTFAQKAASPFFPDYWATHGWGFGVSIVTGRGDIASVPGRYGWDGAFGTSWYSDPSEDLVAILMTQRYANPLASKLNADFHTLAYQAIDD